MVEGGLITLGSGKQYIKGKPILSVITATYNSGKYLEQAIKSVLDQTYENIEFIVVDGASTDSTLDIVCKYSDKLDYWKSEPDTGIYDAMNKGASIASGDYALFLNSDDYLYSKDSVSEVFRVALADGTRPNLILAQMISAVDNEVFPEWIYPPKGKGLGSGNPSHQGTLISSNLYKKIPYNQAFRFAGDYDFWETLRKKNMLYVKYVEKILSVFRMGGTSNCGKHEFLVSLELEICKYMHSGKFSTSALVTGFFRGKIKGIVMGVMGARLYYKYIVYPKYLLLGLFARE